MTNWDEVMAVRVSLLMNSVERGERGRGALHILPGQQCRDRPANRSNDRRLRQEFSALVSVRNSVL